MFRVLTKKKQDEILKRVTACQIIADNHIEDFEALEKITENLADITIDVGGPKGVDKVLGTLRGYKCQ